MPDITIIITMMTMITSIMTDPSTPAPCGTHRSLLRLMTWLSPAFPTGAFAYSHGLEWAVEQGDVADEMSLQRWLTDVLAYGAGRNDLILLRHAHRAVNAEVDATFPPPSQATGQTAEVLVVDQPTSSDPREAVVCLDLQQLADLALAMAGSRERCVETLSQGRAFLLAAVPWGVPALPEDMAYPIAVGSVAASHGVLEDDVAVAFLQAFTANLVSAAVRLVPLGQTAGLRVLAALEPTILAIAAETKPASLDDLGGCAFRSDLAAMCHETQYTRLFRS